MGTTTFDLVTNKHATFHRDHLLFCRPAPNKLVTMQWPKNTQDKDAILQKAIEATKKQNEELYAKYTDAELLDLEQLAEKFDDKVVKKFEKIAQIRAFKELIDL